MIEDIFKLLIKIPHKKRILVITGEGMSANHGSHLNYIRPHINNIDAINTEVADRFLSNKEKMTILTLEYFLNNPTKFYNFINRKRNILNHIQPNEAHYALYKLESFFKDKFSLITTNIDNLHIKAGNYRVIEAYGNILENVRLDPILLEEVQYKNIIENRKILKTSKEEVLRPDIVLEGEQIKKKIMLQMNILAQQADIVIIVGNKLNDINICELPLIAKKSNNAKIIEINKDKRFCSITDIFLHMHAELILPILVNIIIEIEKNSYEY